MVVDLNGNRGLNLLFIRIFGGFLSDFQLEFKIISFPESGLANKMYRCELSDGFDISVLRGGVPGSEIGFGIFGYCPRGGK